MEQIQFIAVLLWMIGMLALVIYAMRDLIKSENEEHRQRQAQEPPATTAGDAAKSTPDKH